MTEKVNPCHPDKVADRIAGAIVDLAYSKNENPKCAVEVLFGHGLCTIIAETSEDITEAEARSVVDRLCGTNTELRYILVPQDQHLAQNQQGAIRCGDNGIFKGTPLTEEQKELSRIARAIYQAYPTDGKYILAGDKLVICQSNASTEKLKSCFPKAIVNPIGEWTGGADVDSGATNRKLGSDMADGVTGGGLHGKDLSKADVSVNIWCFLEAQKRNTTVQACCAIGDRVVNGVPYAEIVEVAREFIRNLGGFEKFAEWGLF